MMGLFTRPIGSKNWKRNLPRGIAKISLDGESLLKSRRTVLATARVDRYRRSVIRFKGAGDVRRAEHALKIGEKAVVRYRRDGILK